MALYRIRPATLDDIDALVHHRIAMFTEMNSSMDPAAVDAAFRSWLAETVPSGTYRAWVAETPEAVVVAGGGFTLLPWPPGPQWLGGRVAFVYNIYTEPTHRLRGLARSIMDAIHDWCRTHGIGVVALTASAAARPLYESMGYGEAASPTLWAALE